MEACFQTEYTPNYVITPNGSIMTSAMLPNGSMMTSEMLPNGSMIPNGSFQTEALLPNGSIVPNESMPESTEPDFIQESIKSN